MQQALEPLECLAVVKHELRDTAAVDLAVLAQDLRPQALDHRGLDLGVGADQVMDDLVARDDGGSVARKCLQRLALARPDAACDGDGQGLIAALRRLVPARALLQVRPRARAPAAPPPRAQAPPAPRRAPVTARRRSAGRCRKPRRRGPARTRASAPRLLRA